MQTESKQVPGDPGTERAVVLQVLNGKQYSRATLRRELHDKDPQAISDALSNLEDLGVVIADGERVRASRCARYMDTLGLIAV